MVSIHAPVKVRLEYDPKTQTLSGVSIHAPVKVRREKSLLPSPPLGFNSRTREGATQISLIYWKKTFVSIHAPVKVRHMNAFVIVLTPMFQFTHP